MDGSRPATWRPLGRPVLWAAGAALLTLVAALIGVRLQADGIALFWPAAGVIAGLILASTGADRRGVMVGVLVALAIGNAMAGRSLATSLVFMAGNVGEAALVAAFLERAIGRPFRLDGTREIEALLLALVGAPALVGLAAALALRWTGQSTGSFAEVWGIWLTSHAVGLLALAPPLLLLAGLGEDALKYRAGEAAAAAGIGIYSFDVEKGRSTWSPELRRILGRGPASEIGFEQSLAFLHPDDRQAARAAMEDAMRRPGRYEIEYRVLRPDGTTSWLLDRGEALGPVDAASGRVRRCTGSIVDITDRKLAEETLRAGELRFRQLFEQVPDGLFVASPDGRYVDVNAAGCRMLGLTREAVLGRTIADIIVPEERPRLPAEVALLAQGGVHLSEWRFRRGDGSEFVGEVAARHLADGRLQAVLRDISERKRHEARLRESEALARAHAEEIEALYDAVPVGLVLLDREGRFVRVNDELAKMTGRPARDWIGHPIEEILSAATVAALRGIFARLLGGEAMVQVEHADQDRRTGRPGLWLVRYRAIRDAAGEVTHFQGSVQDLSDRKRAEDALRQSEQRFAHLLHRLPVGVGLLDRDGQFVLHNPELARIVGGVIPSRAQAHLWRAVDETGRPIPPQDFPSSRALRGEHPPEMEFATNAEGEQRWVRVLAAPYEQDGTVTGAVVVARDVTERKHAEERIQLLMREVNHRAKNLLALVRAVARQTAAEDVGEFLEQFDERLQALAASQDLLVQGQWRGVEFGDLVRAQLAHFRDLVGNRVVLDGPPLRIGARAAQMLGMALHELATNAGKYGALSDATGRVELHWLAGRPGEPAARFRLAWTERDGPAVEQPERPGFGSTVLTDLVRMAFEAEVQLGFESTGLAWTMDCPLAKILDQSFPAATEPPRAEPVAGSRRILVVDDEPIVALDIAANLERAGFSIVGPAGDVRSALDLIENAGCDAAVLDINLGHGTAQPLAEHLRGLGVPYIAVSGYSRDQLPEFFKDVTLLSKPVRKDALVAAVQRCVGP